MGAGDSYAEIEERLESGIRLATNLDTFAIMDTISLGEHH